MQLDILRAATQVLGLMEKKKKAQLTQEQKHLISFKLMKKVDKLCKVMSGGARSVALTELQRENGLVNLKVLVRASTRVMGYHTEIIRLLMVRDGLTSYKSIHRNDKLDRDGEKVKMSDVLPSNEDAFYHDIAQVAGVCRYKLSDITPT